MNNNYINEETNDEALNLREAIRPYLIKWYWFVVSAIVAITIAWFLLRYSIPVYSTQSTLLIKEVNKSISNQPEISVVAELGGIGGMGTNSVDNEIEILKSKKLMLSVVKELGLETNIYLDGQFQDKELYDANSPFTVRIISEKNNPSGLYPINAQIIGEKIILTSEKSKNAITTSFNKVVMLPIGLVLFQKNPNFIGAKHENSSANYRLQFMSSINRARYFLSMLKVSLAQKEATVINLQMNYPVPEKAQKVLNQLAINYNREAVIDKNSEAQKTALFIDDRIKKIGQELGKVEDEKEGFKVKNNIADIQTEAGISLNAEMTTRQAEIENESQLELINSLITSLSNQGTYQVLPLNVGLSDSGLASDIATLNQMIIERNRLLESSTPSNPVVKDVTNQVNSMRNSVMLSLQKTRKALEINKNSIVSEQDRLASTISKIPAQEKLFRSIERQQNIKEQLYLLLLQKREEAAISLAIAAPKARIVDDALTDPTPVSPKRNIFYLGALIIGLLIPFVIIYILKLFDHKIESKKDLEKLLDESIVIGELPSLDENDSEFALIDVNSSLAEVFRILITNINFMLPKGKKGNVIFITSTIKGEGKTFTAVNLALTLGTPRKKIIIIGSDIRNPKLHYYNKIDRNLRGLTEYMHDPSITAEEITHSTNFNPNCDIIYSGSITPNPTELLSNGRYQELIESLKSKYDYIILDTAPMMLVTDSFLIADVADVTLYVTRSGYTDKELVSFINKQVKDKKIKNVGVVLNDVPENHRSYGYGYSYKYGYGYGADTPKTFLQKIFKR